MYLVKRKKIYHLFWKDDSGKLHSISTRCSTKSDAYQFASNYLKDLKEEKTKQLILTYMEFQDFYSDYASNRFSKSYQEFIKYAFQQFNRVLQSDTLLKEITERDIEQFIKLKLSEAGMRIVNGYLRTLQGSFQRGVELGYLEKNIFKNVKKLKPQENHPIFLSKDEMEKVLATENQELYRLIFKFAVYTGMRMSEIIYLKWESIDFTREVIQVKNHNEFTTKSKKMRNIPLHNCLVDELSKIKSKNSTDYVFKREGQLIKRGTLTERFKYIVLKAKLNPDYHFHSLRHTFASWLVQKGVSIYEVSKLLGHSDIKTTQIYAHLRGDDLKRAVDML